MNKKFKQRDLLQSGNDITNIEKYFLKNILNSYTILINDIVKALNQRVTTWDGEKKGLFAKVNPPKIAGALVKNDTLTITLFIKALAHKKVLITDIAKKRTLLGFKRKAGNSKNRVYSRKLTILEAVEFSEYVKGSEGRCTFVDLHRCSHFGLALELNFKKNEIEKLHEKKFTKLELEKFGKKEVQKILRRYLIYPF